MFLRSSREKDVQKLSGQHLELNSCNVSAKRSIVTSNLLRSCSNIINPLHVHKEGHGSSRQTNHAISLEHNVASEISYYKVRFWSAIQHRFFFFF